MFSFQYHIYFNEFNEKNFRIEIPWLRIQSKNDII
jgi:hypothetical protein